MSHGRPLADPAGGSNLASAAVEQLLTYPYKVWGYGEDIALRAMLDVHEVTGDTRAADFVESLVAAWSSRRPAIAAADHVAPGVPLLMLYERFGHDHLLDTAVRLGRLHTGFREVDGPTLHREDLAEWRSTIWVDCMAMDAPFLVLLARTTGERAWEDHGVAQLQAYAHALRDPEQGWFHHGFDVATGLRSPCAWARGNGWALHGLVDTVAMLAPAHHARASLMAIIADLLAALTASQDADSGYWHTVLDDASTPLEHSTAPLFASAALKARRLGLVEPSAREAVDAMVTRATRATIAAVQPDGGLQVSNATPIGDRETYATRALGVYPWGQGPLLLTLLELHRAGKEADS